MISAVQWIRITYVNAIVRRFEEYNQLEKLAVPHDVCNDYIIHNHASSAYAFLQLLNYTCAMQYSKQYYVSHM
jgi:hypothetical protein